MYLKLKSKNLKMYANRKLFCNYKLMLKRNEKDRKKCSETLERKANAKYKSEQN